LRYWAISTLAAGMIGLGIAAGAETAPKGRHVVIRISPPVVVPYLWASISVGGLGDATGVDVRMLGATNVRGDQISWMPLHRLRRDWEARLPQPVLPGIYPVDLRVRPTLEVISAPVVYVRVYEAGTTTRPTFATPAQVAIWWVADVAGGTVVAIRRWQATALDHRLPSLHRLLVTSYDLPNTSGSTERLGIWITAVREGYSGNWRLLDASVTPP
jgi:hypothetical protein